MIILLNAVYGFMMVVIHMFIFRERSTIMEAMDAQKATPAAPAGPGAVAGGSAGGIASRHKDNWYLQIIDLDIAWAHGVLGLGDWYLCMLGLLYGVVIIAFSLFVLHAVITYSRTAGVITRWFMMFLHMELILYIALVLIKLPLLCKAKKHFLTLMDEDCQVLRFMFFERAASRIILGSLCCWVFSSFAYLLAWGDAAVDDPTLADDLDQDLRLRAWRQPRPQSVAVSGPPGRLYPVDEVRSGTRASFDRGSVGEPVTVSGGAYEPRWVSGGPSKSFASIGGGGSFNAGRYGGSQLVMPRASSSIQSNMTDASYPERQMLIKPPIVIH